MKNMKLKIIITAFFAVLMITVCAIPCFAQFDMAGHYDPNGTTSTYYAYPSGECNRTINVSMYDLNGNFIKEWGCQSDAARYYGCYPSHISECTRGLKKQIKGFIWKRKRV